MTAGNLASLRQTFASHEWPIFKDLTRVEQTSTVIVEVPASLYWFRGHFPEQAVLPGVVQTHWAALIGQHLYPVSGAFSHIDNLKFHQVILPEAQVSLILTPRHAKHTLAFAYRHHDKRCSEGKLVFAGPLNG